MQKKCLKNKIIKVLTDHNQWRAFSYSLKKDELGWQIMKGFAALKPKIYCYIKDNHKEEKKGKGTTKNVLWKRKLSLMTRTID